jgi:hypothetical protein
VHNNLGFGQYKQHDKKENKMVLAALKKKQKKFAASLALIYDRNFQAHMV